jgi:hypothetical protein
VNTYDPLPNVEHCLSSVRAVGQKPVASRQRLHDRTRHGIPQPGDDLTPSIIAGQSWIGSAKRERTSTF